MGIMVAITLGGSQLSETPDESYLDSWMLYILFNDSPAEQGEQNCRFSSMDFPMPGLIARG